MINISANYHTHTKRCGHAVGEDREYVEAAIEAGLKTLGFSDHTPYPTGTDFVSGMRIRFEDTDDYFKSISSLKKEYAKDIEIFCGVEAEYWPDHFDLLLDYMKGYPLDYMILGEHFVPDEEHGAYMGGHFEDPYFLHMYTDFVIEAINTGKFSYIAHPDLPAYDGPDKDSELENTYRRICLEAKKLSIPLEINVLGSTRRGPYPSAKFFDIAKEYENDVIIGVDAHNPNHFFNNEKIDECIDIAKSRGLNIINKLRMPAL